MLWLLQLIGQYVFLGVLGLFVCLFFTHSKNKLYSRVEVTLFICRTSFFTRVCGALAWPSLVSKFCDSVIIGSRLATLSQWTCVFVHRKSLYTFKKLLFHCNCWQFSVRREWQNATSTVSIASVQFHRKEPQCLQKLTELGKTSIFYLYNFFWDFVKHLVYHGRLYLNV